MNKDWYCYDDDEGFTWHATADEAREEARRRMTGHRLWAADEGEWSDSVMSLSWGRRFGCVAEIADAYQLCGCWLFLDATHAAPDRNHP